MVIRRVTPEDDFTVIGNIYAASWRGAYQGLVPQGYLDSLEGGNWAAFLADRPENSYLIIEDGKYIGTAAISPARDEEMAGWGEVVSLYLLPEYFGKGYAKPLFDHAAEGLLEQGYRALYLWVLQGNIRARRFYEKQGFSPNGDTAAVTIEDTELTEVRYCKRF